MNDIKLVLVLVYNKYNIYFEMIKFPFSSPKPEYLLSSNYTPSSANYGLWSGGVYRFHVVRPYVRPSVCPSIRYVSVSASNLLNNVRNFFLYFA